MSRKKQNQKPKQESEATSFVLSPTRHQKQHHLQKPQKAIKPTRKAIKPKQSHPARKYLPKQEKKKQEQKPKPTNLLSHPNKHHNCRNSQDDAQSHHPMPNHSRKKERLIRHRNESPTSYSFFARMCHRLLMRQEKDSNAPRSIAEADAPATVEDSAERITELPTFLP